MNKSTFARRIAGLFLAAGLAIGGLLAGASLDAPDNADQTEEVAGGTWSITAPNKGGGATINGGTWS